MKKLLFTGLALILAATAFSCGNNQESARESTAMNNTSSIEQPTLLGIDDSVSMSDGIIPTLDQNELITKLSALHEGTSLDEVIRIFGKEPYWVKEANENIFKYFSGDITITLWGTQLFQAAVEYKDSTLMIDLN